MVQLEDEVAAVVAVGNQLLDPRREAAEAIGIPAGTPAELKAAHRSASLPEPSMEDAFIALIEAHTAGKESATKKMLLLPLIQWL